LSSTKQEVGLDGDTIGPDYVSKLNYDIKLRTIVVLLLGVKSSIVQSSRKSKSKVGPKKKLALYRHEERWLTGLGASNTHV